MLAIAAMLCQRRGSSNLGRLAQLVEHLVYTERVGSSSLSSPTIPFHVKINSFRTPRNHCGGLTSGAFGPQMVSTPQFRRLLLFAKIQFAG